MPPCHRHMVIATNFSSMFDLLLCSTPQTWAECCLELTAVSGYRMFLWGGGGGVCLCLWARGGRLGGRRYCTSGGQRPPGGPRAAPGVGGAAVVPLPSPSLPQRPPGGRRGSAGGALGPRSSGSLATPPGPEGRPPQREASDHRDYQRNTACQRGGGVPAWGPEAPTQVNQLRQWSLD